MDKINLNPDYPETKVEGKWTVLGRERSTGFPMFDNPFSYCVLTARKENLFASMVDCCRNNHFFFVHPRNLSRTGADKRVSRDSACFHSSQIFLIDYFKKLQLPHNES